MVYKVNPDKNCLFSKDKTELSELFFKEEPSQLEAQMNLCLTGFIWQKRFFFSWNLEVLKWQSWFKSESSFFIVKEFSNLLILSLMTLNSLMHQSQSL